MGTLPYRSNVAKESPMPRPSVRRALAVFVLGSAAVVAACSPPAAPTSGPSAAAPAGAVQALPAEVSVQQASAMNDAGAFLLDVRQPQEWQAGHIAGATLVPLGELPARLAEVPRGRQVVVVCHSGNRSAKGRDVLLAAGYPSVTSMAGGMTAWTAAGFPMTTGS
jgi:rhodanese-related sulfurtransferase